MKDTNLYPPTPTELPAKLTSLTSSYMQKAFVAILAIILFFILYISMVVGFGYLAKYSVLYEMKEVNKGTILVKVAAVAGSIMLFVFSLKFIFKLKNHKPSNRIKLDANNHSRLRDFIYQICEDTSAPKPKSIYVDPDVNAYVSYTNSWQSLFFPTKKDLTIGLGLVSTLNLSEFKAVMAHEFGHFAQKSMKIGSYIMSANTIIHDMIYSRDRWDEMLDVWRATDLRLSFGAWLITPIIWVIRQLLALFYQFLNVMYSSLSREMEFNADKVAISVSGSDSIISALWKLDSGFTHWNDTLNNAFQASNKGQLVSNLYVHNNLAIEKNQPKLNEKLDQLPAHKEGGKRFFAGTTNSKVNMYASHPPNDLRQENAKLPFIPSIDNKQSPWLLFSNPEDLQSRMTTLVYKEYFNVKADKFVDDLVFQQFIQNENRGKGLLEEYQNTFANRFLKIPPREEIKAGGNINVTSQVIKEELTDLMNPILKIEELMAEANSIANGTSLKNAFVFEGKEYGKSKLEEGYNLLLSKRDEVFNTEFKDWDEKFCKYVYMVAKEKNREEDLLRLFDQHDAITNLYQSLVAGRQKTYNDLAMVQNNKEATEMDIINLRKIIKDNFKQMNEFINELDQSTFYRLPNINSREELKSSIVKGGQFEIGKGDIFKSGEFNIMMGALEQSINNCQRIDQKSIVEILAFQHI